MEESGRGGRDELVVEPALGQAGAAEHMIIQAHVVTSQDRNTNSHTHVYMLYDHTLGITIRRLVSAAALVGRVCTPAPPFPPPPVLLNTRALEGRMRSPPPAFSRTSAFA